MEHLALSVDEFFDAEEIILSNLSADDDDKEDVEFYGSREFTSNAPSEMTSEHSEVSEEMVLPPLPSPIAVSEVSGKARGFRQRMPRLAPPCTVSISSILRKSIGKDWTAIPMPVALNEPLSALQRLCEELEYSDLLDEASLSTCPLDRMVLVAAFAVSAYAATVHRAERKPFTPILGETFEYERLDKGYRFIAEKVSHRPLIIACHAQSEKWSFWQDQRIKNKFWGKSMEYMPIGNVHVFFPDTGDHFVWNKVVTCVRNILMGNKWVENYGDMILRNLRTGDRATITFKPNSSGLFSSNSPPSNEVVATLVPFKNKFDIDCAPITLRGRWDSMLCKEKAGGLEPRLVWRASPVPNDHVEYYGFTEFAIGLNDLPEWLLPHLPQTDSRLRPDQRLLENGLLTEAEERKQEIERLQRKLRQEFEANCRRWEPLWFKFEPPTEDEPDGVWLIKDPLAYWESRRLRDWPAQHSLW